MFMHEGLKSTLRQLLPKSVYKILAPVYHGLMAYLAMLYYGSPGSELKLIGVTGTSGKSTTVVMLAHILNSAGLRAGYITTTGTSDGKSVNSNHHGLSMPGPWLLQKTLHEFVAKGCSYAIIEATSEGLAQNRHLGLKFDGVLFTNLSPAHLDAHGSFENYRAAKGKLFAEVKSSGFIGVNTDDPNFEFFLNFPARKKFGVSTREDKILQVAIPIMRALDIKVDTQLHFVVEAEKFSLNLKGSFNISNALLAICTAQYLGVSLEQSGLALNTFGGVSGRMELVPNNHKLTIIVDYAPEPASMEASLRAVLLIPHNKLIHVFGATGGHRDVAKRFEFGQLSGKFADTIIITNDDVYDSDEQEIANGILQGINQLNNEQKKVSQIYTILDRKSALTKALEVAVPGDIILVTGKGSEQFLVLPGNKRITWEDKKILEELL